MKILFTGGSSFTGLWFVKELHKAGFDVTTVFTNSAADNYSGIRRDRVNQLAEISAPVFDCGFGSEKFLSLIRSEKFDILCHHAAEVKDYKSPDFDAVNALRLNTFNLSEVLKALNGNNFRGVILTGSVFEASEGEGEKGENFLDAFSPYGLSKTLTFNLFKYYCRAMGIQMGKFVIPNPFGPYEEPRFTGYLIKSWYAAKTAEVSTPLYFRDNIHVGLLAEVYVYFLNRMLNSKENFLRINPSGYPELMSAFTKRFSDEMKRRLDLSCEFKLKEQTVFTEPVKRINTELASEIISDWNEQKAWDNLAEYYKTSGIK